MSAPSPSTSISLPFLPGEVEEITRIRAMFPAKERRDREACIEIGKRGEQLLTRKDAQYRETHPKGKFNAKAYWHVHFGENAAYLRQFIRLAQQAAKLEQADHEQAARGWKNPEIYEPRKSLELLKWHSGLSSQAASDIKKRNVPSPIALDWLTVLVGDCRKKIDEIADGSVTCCVTSFPYWSLRDNGMPDQIGLEPTLEEHVRTLVDDVFVPFMKKLNDRGVLFVIVGDNMASSARSAKAPDHWHPDGLPAKPAEALPAGCLRALPERFMLRMVDNGGFMLRSEIIWQKTGQHSHGRKAVQPVHEKIYMFTKSMNYDFHQKAIQAPSTYTGARSGAKMRRLGHEKPNLTQKDLASVWLIPSHKVAHEGRTPLPVELVRRCVLLGSEEGDLVVDLFGGTGTLGLVCKWLKRRCTLIEINPQYAAAAERRIAEAPNDPPKSWKDGVAATEVELLLERIKASQPEVDELLASAKRAA